MPKYGPTQKWLLEIGAQEPLGHRFRLAFRIPLARRAHTIAVTACGGVKSVGLKSRDSRKEVVVPSLAQSGRGLLAAIRLAKRLRACKRFRRNLLDYNLLDLDPRAFDFAGPLKFRYEYRVGKTLSSEVFSSPFHNAAPAHSARLYHPAIAYFHQYLETGDPKVLSRFLELADALAETLIPHNLDGFVYYSVPIFGRHREYSQHPIPWTSSHSQCWALSIFCRAA